MPAYYELYFQDTIELMEAVFRQVAGEKKWNFEVFVSGFMNCKYRKFIDEGNARVMNMAIDELLSYLHRDCPEIFVEGECKVDVLMAGWIGGMYNRIQFYSCKTSKEIYQKIPLDRMIQFFQPLHTVDEEVATEKILHILFTTAASGH